MLGLYKMLSTGVAPKTLTGENSQHYQKWAMALGDLRRESYYSSLFQLALTLSPLEVPGDIFVKKR